MKPLWVLYLLLMFGSAYAAEKRTLIYDNYLPATLSLQCEAPGKRFIAKVEIMNATHIVHKDTPKYIFNLMLPAHKFAEDGSYVVNHFIVQNQDDSLALFTGRQKYLYTRDKAPQMLELPPRQSVTISVNLYDYFDIKPEQLKRFKFDLFGVRVQTPGVLIEQDIQSNWGYVKQGC
ncbi:hypothetical protein SAMN05660691_01628 [Rheinheimera pacifica]|uniref:Uncharacterized protein n=1 Tax=Rheinheimera pacifica TaxID=173990 RepID=A0A1H6L018_9GAMM|nr:hypothetical protein [Rheinheimera pacifica]SEH81354.1 hypothetical protein SAMN05660691_01628 [Rheinheimera pacifica]